MGDSELGGAGMIGKRGQVDRCWEDKTHQPDPGPIENCPCGSLQAVEALARAAHLLVWTFLTLPLFCDHL